LGFREKLNKIALYHDDEWQEYRAEKGVQQIIRIHQTYFFEIYEQCILKQLYENDSHDARTRTRYMTQLKDYYKYLVIFDLQPFACDRENNDIVTKGPYYGIDNEHYISEKAQEVYQEAKQELSKAEINNYKKEITNLIKKNTQASLRTLNDTLTSIINMDERFKKVFFERNQGLLNQES
jgi:hypothetical protein